MKKTWKNILCSLMLAPCMFWATACGDPEEPGNLTVDLSAEQQQEAYTTLRTLASATLNKNEAKEQAYTLKASNEHREVMDITNAGLSADNKALVEDSFDLVTSNKITRNVYGGYKSNNTGYRVDTLKAVNANGTTYINDSLTEVVKYNGQYYELYKNENDTKELSRVNNTYAKEAIVVDANVISSDSQSKGGELLEIFSTFESKEDFTAFKTDLVNWSMRNLAINKIEDAFEQDFSEFVTTSYKFSLTDDVYTLDVDMTLDTTEGAFVYVLDGVLKGEGSLTVAFDNNQIRNIAFNYSSNMVLEQSSASVFGGVVDQEFASNNTVTTTNSNIVNISLDFTAAFDTNFFNQTLSGYVGTGANGAVQNNQVNATIMFINNNINIEPLETKFTTGENCIDNVYDAIVPVLLQNDLEVGAYNVLVNNGSYFTPEMIDEDYLVPETDFVVYVYFANDNVEVNN